MLGELEQRCFSIVSFLLSLVEAGVAFFSWWTSQVGLTLLVCPQPRLDPRHRSV